MGRERHTQRDLFVAPLIYAFTDWSLYVSWPEIKLAYQDSALTMAK